jgi:OOP family OmpA-OmpF porin
MEAVLTGPDGIDAERLRAIGARLDATLPAVLALSTVAPPQMAALPGGGRVYAPEFAAALLADGTVRLTGPLRDELSRSAIESYAAALFGHAKVTSATVIDPGLPEGWPGRVLAGVEALSMLKEGKVEVTPQEVAVAGWGVAADGAAAVETLLAAKQIGGAVLDIRFDAAAAEIAARLPAEVCAETVADILSANGIAFQPGSSTLEDASGDVITAIAAALRGCPGAAFEIAGHTDSQGRAEVNQRISEARAAAVLAALEAEDLPLVSLTAVGRGATVPIADNTTEAGRARNRRIEFSLVVPEAATLRMLPPVQEVSGEPG